MPSRHRACACTKEPEVFMRLTLDRHNDGRTAQNDDDGNDSDDGSNYCKNMAFTRA